MSRTSSRTVGATLCAALALLVAACGNREPKQFVQANNAGATDGGAVERDGATAGLAGGGSDAAGAQAGGGAVGVPVAPVPGGGTTGSGANAPASSPAGPAGAIQGQSAAESTGPTRYDQGASDTEIRLGSVSSLSGVLKQSMNRATSAYIKSVNAKGGVNGRRIVYLSYDDQWDATRQAALVRQAYQSDKVFAFVNNFAMVTAHGGRAFVEENGIPVVGGDGIDVLTWGKSANYYPIAYLESSTGPRILGRFAKQNGCKAVANIQDNVDAGRLWSKSFEQGMQDIDPGSKFVYSAEVPLTTTDLSAQLNRAKQAGADCLTLGGLDHNLARKNADQLDYQPRFYLPSPGYDRNYAKNFANADGDYVMLQTDILENVGTNQALKRYVDDMNRYEPGALNDGTVPTWHIQSYVSAMVMVEALQRAGNELTKKHLFDVLNSMTNFETGIVNPITYRPGPHPGATCGYVVQLKSKTFRVVKPDACL